MDCALFRNKFSIFRRGFEFKKRSYRLRADRGATTQNSRLPRRGGNTGCTHFIFISLYIFRQTLPVVTSRVSTQSFDAWVRKKQLIDTNFRTYPIS